MEADVDPEMPDPTYQWSKDSGVGDGTFDPSDAEITEFAGSSKGQLTVKVVVTSGGTTCEGKQDVVVIEIGELPDVEDQFMEEYYLDGLPSATHVIPYNASQGELRRVRIKPPEDDSQPFQWRQCGASSGDFEGCVDHVDGSVRATFYRPGPYLVETLRVVDEGESNAISTTEVFIVYYEASDQKEMKGKDGVYRRASPLTADLVLISDSSNDNGYLVKARKAFDGEVAIGSVQDVVDAVNDYGSMHEGGFTLMIVDHGTVARQSMGDGDKKIAGGYIDDSAATSADYDAFVDACRDNGVTLTTLLACDVAGGTAGPAWLQKMADDAQMTVRGYTKKNCYTSEKKWWLIKGGSWVEKSPQ